MALILKYLWIMITINHSLIKPRIYLHFLYIYFIDNVENL